MHEKALIAISFTLLAGFFYQESDALAVYFLRFTIADHASHIVRNFNVVLYDYEHDHKVTMDVPDEIFAVITEGCGSSTFSFPKFYTCERYNMTIDLFSKSGFVVTFV
jgi:hypothetical protein